jgi:peptide deformylase
LKTSRPVTDFNKRLHILIDDMRETMLAANGLGLAAPQVGALRRVVLIVDAKPDDTDDAGDADDARDAHDAEDVPAEDRIVELVNPEIIAECGEQSGNEGCLSIPELRGIVKRPEEVTVRAFDRFGKPFEITGKQITARALCHEIDHLNGILFTSLAERFLTDEELAELAKESEETE